MTRARVATVAGLAAVVLAIAGTPHPAVAKSAYFEIRNRCPCPGPTAGSFWSSRAERLGCVDGVLADLTAAGWPESILVRDRRREERSRCGDPRFQCDGTAGRRCPRGFACEAFDPSCSAGGVPSVCARPRELRRLHGCANEPPACGCDGRTYRTPCELWRAGAVEAHPQTCARGCAGPDHLGCAVGAYCSVTGCGDDGAWGSCEPKPAQCDVEHAAVCGCDGMTYPSTCIANSFGVSVRSIGACAP